MAALNWELGIAVYSHSGEHYNCSYIFGPIPNTNYVRYRTLAACVSSFALADDPLSYREPQQVRIRFQLEFFHDLVFMKRHRSWRHV
jgi:hypothetical protein